MQVAIDARMILPEMTGVGRYILGLAGALRDLQDANAYELWLQPGLSEEHPVWGLQSPRIQLRELSLRHMDYRQQWLLPAEVRRRKPDLLHYPHFDLPVAVSGAVVATIHDLKYIARPDFFPTFSRSKQFLMKKNGGFYGSPGAAGYRSLRKDTKRPDSADKRGCGKDRRHPRRC